MVIVTQQSPIINSLICKPKVSWVLCYTCSYTVAKISTLKARLLLYTQSSISVFPERPHSRKSSFNFTGVLPSLGLQHQPQSL